MSTILLLATTTGYQIRSFGAAARKLGVRLVFASDRCDQLDDPWWDEAVPVRFHQPQPSIGAIVEAFGGQRPDGVIAVGDRPVVLASHAAAAFGLPGNPVQAAATSRNKLESRQAFARAGLLVPSFRAVSLRDDPAVVARAVEYPAVVKPLALTGSCGVMRVDDVPACEQAIGRLRRLLEAPDVRQERDPAHDQVLLESFVPGEEFAIEGVLTEGRFRALAIFDKPDPLNGPFFEETLYVTPSREAAETQGRMVAAVAAGAEALGLRHGPVHAECRVNEAGVYLLEVAGRPIGGLCSHALRFASSISSAGGVVSLEELLLRHALGEDVAGLTREPAASGVMMIPIPHRGVYRGVRGVERARAVAGVDDVQITVKQDALVVPLPEGRSYLGFVFAHAAEPAGVERALRAAHASLEFAIVRDLVLADR